MMTDIPEDCEDCVLNVMRFSESASWFMLTWEKSDNPQGYLQMAWCEQTRAADMAGRIAVDVCYALLRAKAMTIKKLYEDTFEVPVDEKVKRGIGN